jgi:hypothetical protein
VYEVLVNDQGNAKANSLPVLGHKSIIDLLVEYLSMLAKAINLNIKAILGEVKRIGPKLVLDYNYILQNNIQYCFAVPYWFSAPGKEAFGFAARAAELTCPGSSSGIAFISDIEATLLYYINEGKANITDGDVILVVNFGNAVVDLASYTVRNTDQFLVEFTHPTAGYFE